MRKTLAAAFAFFFLILVFPASAFSGPPAFPEVQTYNELLRAIRETKAGSRARIEAAVEKEKVREAWETGKLIDEHILHYKERAGYGEQVIVRLAGDLDTSETELRFMLQFARAYPIHWPADELSWSHYQSLLALNDPEERAEVAKEAREKGWTRDRIREEVRRRKRPSDPSEGPAGLPVIGPGVLDTYRIIRLKDRLKIDLGFGIYRDLPEKDSKKFKEGNIVAVTKRPKGDPAIAVSKTASPSGLYTYGALVTRVVDGDTFHALIDLGFGTTLAQRVRLRRIDAPEIVSAEGKTAKAFLEKILSRDRGRIILQSRELDQYGRPIADVWVRGKPVDQELFEQGLAIAVNG